MKQNAFGSLRRLFYASILSLIAFSLVVEGRAQSLDALTMRFTGIAAGEGHSLALKADGTVVAWGANYEGQSAVPDKLNGVTAIAAGRLHSLALKTDGTVIFWGDNQSLENRTPQGLAGVVAIAAGTDHSLALGPDGTVVAWGANRSGESSVPSGLNTVVAIAAGGEHSLALKADGTVVAWGDNSDGESAVPVGLSGIVAIAAGTYHNLALKRDGTVIAWGSNMFGARTVPPDLSGVVAIAAGGYFSLALKNDGFVAAWGDYRSGENIVPPDLGGVVAISAGSSHALALKSDGTLVGWGDNSAGELPQPVILEGPASQKSLTGVARSFSVMASGLPPLSYQWRKNGVAISGATAPGYSITNVQGKDAGTYSVLVTNIYGSLTSADAVLTVAPIIQVGSLSPKGVDYLMAQMEGRFVYLAGYNAGLIALDVSNPAEPTLVGADATTTAEGSLKVSDGRVYYAGASFGQFGRYGLQIADVDASGKTKRIGTYETAEIWDLAVAGGYVYLGGEAGLKIIDVTNPAAPVLKAVWGRNVSAIAPKGNLAIVAADGVLDVLDLSDPSLPRLEGSLSLPGYQTKIALGVGYAYIVGGTEPGPNARPGPLEVVDIRDPNRLLLLASLPLDDWTRALTIDGATVIIASVVNSVSFVDVSDPAKPTVVGQYKMTDSFGVASAGGLTCIASLQEVHILNTSDPANPKLIGRYLPPRIGAAGTGAAVADANYYYILSTDHLWSYDLSDPKTPLQLSVYDINPPFGAYSPNDLKINQGYAYAVGERGGMRIIDLRDPAKPTSTGVFGIENTYSAMAIAGSHAALARTADWDKPMDWQVELLDISAPASPRTIGEYRPGGFILALAYSGKFYLWPVNWDCRS